MIGLGKWVCNVDSMFYRGEVFFTISDNNGQYAFDLTFETDDTFTGLVKIPFIGKIKLKDGRRAP